MLAKHWRFGINDVLVNAMWVIISENKIAMNFGTRIMILCARFSVLQIESSHTGHDIFKFNFNIRFQGVHFSIQNMVV